MVAVVFIFLVMLAGLGAGAYYVYSRKLHRAKAIERGLKMVPVQIHLPPQSSDTTAGGRDVRDVMRETTSQAKTLYELLAGTATAEGFKSRFYGQRHIGLELVASGGLLHFYAAVPVALVSVVEKAIQTAYPGARLEEVEDHNIFNRDGRLAATMGGELVLRAEAGYPIATYEELERDPMTALITTLSALGKGDGAAIQVMLRPAGTGWTARSKKIADSIRTGKPLGLAFKPADLIRAATGGKAADKPAEAPHVMTSLEQALVERIEKKTRETGFEVLVRLVVSTHSVATSQQLMRDLSTAFALFESPGSNGFKFLPAVDVQGLVTAFILRFFPPELRSNVLNTSELATLFHLPDAQFVPTANVARLASKEIDGPVSLPTTGLLFGYNEFRGVKKEIRLSAEDRRRHTYILGQTGTGKSTMLENLITQDMRAGNGFAFIDPHGDSAEKLLSLVPKARAEDVIYFNPADTDYPLGLNLFEFDKPEQKDFIVQETINMLYKLYDPGHTGIIGPRYEHWYRNAALTLMSDPNGSTFIEIPKVFTDTEYLKQKFRYLKDPTVIDFWTKEMGQTSDYHKSEMLGWFVSKFGAFQNNEMMRNIIGQTKSSFNLRDVMDNKKILIVNLSKGRIGELNSQLLGMIFVIKFQAAAMSRANMPEAQRNDFALYVDEFQNFSTDSFASILSEARKYRLNLIVANQFIGQLTPEIRDAVFGNIGTIIAHRMGPEDAEFMVRQFAPVFDASDLVNIPNYHSVMRLMNGGLPSAPFTVANAPYQAGGNPELGSAIKQLSAAKFGAAKAVVEADITSRLSASVPAPVAIPESAPAVAAEPTEVPVDEPVQAEAASQAAPPNTAQDQAANEIATPVVPEVPQASIQTQTVSSQPVAVTANQSVRTGNEDNEGEPVTAAAVSPDVIPAVELSFGDITGGSRDAQPPITSPVPNTARDTMSFEAQTADQAAKSVAAIPAAGGAIVVPTATVVTEPQAAEQPSGIAPATPEPGHTGISVVVDPQASVAADNGGDPHADVPLIGDPLPIAPTPVNPVVPAAEGLSVAGDPYAAVPLVAGATVQGNVVAIPQSSAPEFVEPASPVEVAAPISEPLAQPSIAVVPLESTAILLPDTSQPQADLDGRTNLQSDLEAAQSLGLVIAPLPAVPAAPVEPAAELMPQPTASVAPAEALVPTAPVKPAESVGPAVFVKPVESVSVVVDLAKEPAVSVQLPQPQAVLTVTPARDEPVKAATPPVPVVSGTAPVSVPTAAAPAPATRSTDEVLAAVMKAAANRQADPKPAPIPKPSADPVAVVATVEDQIDDLLGESLIPGVSARQTISFGSALADDDTPVFTGSDAPSRRLDDEALKSDATGSKSSGHSSTVTGTHHRLPDVEPADPDQPLQDQSENSYLNASHHVFFATPPEPKAPVVSPVVPAPAATPAPKAKPAALTPAMVVPVAPVAMPTPQPQAVAAPRVQPVVTPAPKPDPERPVAAAEPLMPVAVELSAPKPPAPVHAKSSPPPSAQAPKPTEPAEPVYRAATAGSLILPVVNPASRHDYGVAPVAAPPKLAKGEVFVDAKGNVVIGE